MRRFWQYERSETEKIKHSTESTDSVCFVPLLFCLTETVVKWCFFFFWLDITIASAIRFTPPPPHPPPNLRQRYHFNFTLPKCQSYVNRFICKHYNFSKMNRDNFKKGIFFFQNILMTSTNKIEINCQKKERR